MEQNDTKIKISVRNLVEFILRSGDLDNRQGGRRDSDMGAGKQKLKQKSQQYRKQGMRSNKRETEAEKLDVAKDGVSEKAFARFDNMVGEGSTSDFIALSRLAPKALKAEMKEINKKMKNVEKSKKMINKNLQTSEILPFPFEIVSP